MTKIHPTAIIEDGARIGEDCQIGPYAVIGPEVTLGARCSIHAHAVIDGSTTLGDDCQVFESAHIGGKTQDLKFKDGNKTFVKVGNRTVLREFVTVNCGTRDGESTIIGDDCLIMAYCHLAHGCVFGNHIIVSNGTQFAGEVRVDDWAVISGLVGVHQFCRIGRHSMIGASSLITQDVSPYFITVGNPASTHGLNIVGLTRRGFTKQTISGLHSAYKLLCHSGLNVSEAITQIKATCTITPEIEHLIEFFQSTQRGVIR